MSLDAIKWAMAQSVGKASTKFVLVAMADCVNTEAGEMLCWPSYAYLARVTHHDIKTVEVAVYRLKEVGLIVDTGKRRGETGKVIVYRLNSPKNGGIEPGPKATPNTPVFPDNTPKNGDQYPQISQSIPPKTGVRSRKKQEGTGKEAGRAITSVPGVTPEVFADWMAARKRTPVTQTALCAIEREAAKAGITLAQAITYCAEWEWRGFNAGWYAQRMTSVNKSAERTPRPSGNKHTAAARSIWGDDQQEIIDVETY